MNPRKKDEKRKRELIVYMLEHHDVPENLDQEDIYMPLKDAAMPDMSKISNFPLWPAEGLYLTFSHRKSLIRA